MIGHGTRQESRTRKTDSTEKGEKRRTDECILLSLTFSRRSINDDQDDGKRKVSIILLCELSFLQLSKKYTTLPSPP
eukprot:scaffold22639_cov105-Cylindrotheca_fusiformis.AAC.10